MLKLGKVKKYKETSKSNCKRNQTLVTEYNILAWYNIGNKQQYILWNEHVHCTYNVSCIMYRVKNKEYICEL